MFRKIKNKVRRDKPPKERVVFLTPPVKLYFKNTDTYTVKSTPTSK